MRVIGGKLRGKLIHNPTDKTTRPLKDMVRESIFNILEQHVTGINDKNYIIDRTIIDNAFERVINAQLEKIRKEAIDVKMNAVHRLRYRGLKKSNGSVVMNPIPEQVTHPMGEIASFLLKPENHEPVSYTHLTLPTR